MILEWLQALTPQQTAFASTALGIPLGVITLVSGALLNAHLNRRRDDRLREAEVLGIATALLSEINTIKAGLVRNAASLREPSGQGSATHVFIPEMLTDVWQALIPKVTLLDAAAIEAVLNAYVTLPIYIDGLALRAGKLTEFGKNRFHVAVPIANALWVARVTEEMIPVFQAAADQLSRVVAGLKR